VSLTTIATLLVLLVLVGLMWRKTRHEQSHCSAIGQLQIVEDYLLDRLGVDMAEVERWHLETYHGLGGQDPNGERL
jgi:hypothetical protein